MSTDVIVDEKTNDPAGRKIPTRAPKYWKKCRPFKEKFVSGFQELAPSRLSSDGTRDPQYLYEAFTDHSKVGQGSFGSVYKVSCKATSELCAVKVFRIYGLYNWKDTIAKVMMYEKVNRHENVVKLFNVWLEDDTVYLQMELCEKSLLQFMLENLEIEEHYTWDVMTDLLKALKFIHSKDLIHYDVKPENILIGYDGKYKLADFDLIYDLKGEKIQFRAGDHKYRAPEVLMEPFLPDTKYDIFSLGMTLLEMTGDFYLPNGGSVWLSLRHNCFPESQLKDKISNDLIVVLQLMLEMDMNTRPSAAELLTMEIVKLKCEERDKNKIPESNGVKKLMEFNAARIRENLSFLRKLEERGQTPEFDRMMKLKARSMFQNESQTKSPE